MPRLGRFGRGGRDAGQDIPDRRRANWCKIAARSTPKLARRAPAGAATIGYGAGSGIGHRAGLLGDSQRGGHVDAVQPAQGEHGGGGDGAGAEQERGGDGSGG